MINVLEWIGTVSGAAFTGLVLFLAILPDRKRLLRRFLLGREWIVTFPDGSRPQRTISLQRNPITWIRYTYFWYLLVWKTRGGRTSVSEIPPGNRVIFSRVGSHVTIKSYRP